MSRLRHLLTLSLGAALLHLPMVQAEELPEAIKKIEAKGAKIVGQFDAPDGLRGYRYHLEERAAAGAPVRYGRLLRLVSHGSFVVTLNDARYGGAPCRVFDIYRLAGGRIVEHWDAATGTAG